MNNWTSAAVVAFLESQFGSTRDQPGRVRVNNREIASLATSATRSAAGSTSTVTETDRWLGWLSPDDAALVRARAAGVRWKLICWRFGISRPTAWRRWRRALALIAWRLNGQPMPASQSRRRFLEQVRAAGV